MNRSTCRCYVVPPHLLDKLRAHPNAKVQKAALGTLMAMHGIRVRRQTLAAGSRPPRPTGGLRRTIYDAQKTSTLPGTLVRSEGSPATGDVAVTEAYDAAGVTFNFYKEVFDRVSVDDKGHRLDSTVHYQEDPDEPLDNAMWDGEEMLYGDGDGVIFGRFTKSLDVIAHELTHGVTQFEASLEYHDQPGALNESMSDVFGILTKQWSLKQKVADADWLIGRELLLLPNMALRSMKAPGTAYDDPSPNGLGKDPQPDHMTKYVTLPNTRAGDNGGVHINSGIPNRAFYEACVNLTSLGAPYAWDKAGRIWYECLCHRLDATADFAAAKKATVEAAGSLFGNAESTAVEDAWNKVGV